MMHSTIPSCHIHSSQSSLLESCLMVPQVVGSAVMDFGFAGTLHEVRSRLALHRVLPFQGFCVRAL
jgi:hypothetical protein